MEFKQFRFNRFGLAPWESLKWFFFPRDYKVSKKEGMKYKKDFKGVPAIFVSFFFYIITLGYFIFPILWYFKKDIINQRFIGKKDFWEDSIYKFTSYYRYAKILFIGNVYYIFVLFLIKIICNTLNISFINVFSLIVFWFALWNLIPIPLTEGFDYYYANKNFWFISLCLFLFTFFSLVIFNSIILILLTDILIVIIILFFTLKNALNSS